MVSVFVQTPALKYNLGTVTLHAFSVEGLVNLDKCKYLQTTSTLKMETFSINARKFPYASSQPLPQIPADLLSVTVDFLILKYIRKAVVQSVLFCVWPLQFRINFRYSSMLLNVLGAHSLLFLSNIPLLRCATTYLIFLLLNIWAVSSLGLLPKKLLWTFVNKSCGYGFSFLLEWNCWVVWSMSCLPL